MLDQLKKSKMQDVKIVGLLTIKKNFNS